MNADGFRSMTVTLLLLCTSVLIVGAAGAKGGRTKSDHDLVIAVVDSGHATAGTRALRSRIIGTLRTVVAETFGSETQVRPVVVNALDPRLNFSVGAYNAALVIGRDQPVPLQTVNAVRLDAAVPFETGLEPVSLVIANGDPALTARLRVAFARIVARTAPAPRGLEAILPRFASSGARLATIDR